MLCSGYDVGRAEGLCVQCNEFARPQATARAKFDPLKCDLPMVPAGMGLSSSGLVAGGAAVFAGFGGT
jgi:hypothetical protein